MTTSVPTKWPTAGNWNAPWKPTQHQLVLRDSSSFKGASKTARPARVQRCFYSGIKGKDLFRLPVKFIYVVRTEGHWEVFFSRSLCSLRQSELLSVLFNLVPVLAKVD